MTSDDVAAARRRRLALGVLLLVTLAGAYAPRVASYLELRERRPHWDLEGGVVPVNADGYHWLRAARDLRAGRWRVGEIDPLRGHPDGVVRGDPPWPARLLARAADASGGDVYGAALALGLLTSALFALPAFLYGVRVGHPAAGVLAGLTAAASPVVAERSGVQWVDTDALNLFALWWIAWLSCLPGPRQPRRRALALAALAGLSVAAFVGWYERPGFVPVLAVAFTARLAAAGFGARWTALLTVVFLVCANPLHLAESAGGLERFARLYAGRALAPGAADPAPGTAETGPGAAEAGPAADEGPLTREGLGLVASEDVRSPLPEALAASLPPVGLAALGLFGFAAWCASSWRLALPLAPMAALGALGLASSYRLLFFLAPLIGFGLGALTCTVAQRIAARAGRAGWGEPLGVALGLALLAAALGWRGLPPAPGFEDKAELLAGLQRAARALPPGASVWTPDFGSAYAIQDVMGAATFSDGVPDPVRSHLLLRGLADAEPRALQRVIAHLDATPSRQVRDAFLADYAAALDALLAGPGEVRGAPHLLLTRRSVLEFPLIQRVGGWRPGRGWPAPGGVAAMACAEGPRGGRLRCTGPSGGVVRLDLRAGAVEPSGRFGRVVFTRRGRFHSEWALGPATGRQLIVERSELGVSAIAVPDALVASNLGQLFLLGRGDARYFELVADVFPLARLYRVKGDPTGAQPGAALPAGRRPALLSSTQQGETRWRRPRRTSRKPPRPTT